MIRDQNILWLQISVVDSLAVAELDGIQDLEERVFCKWVVSNKIATLSDIREQVSFRAELNDHIGTVVVRDYAGQRNHIGMLASPGV